MRSLSVIHFCLFLPFFVDNGTGLRVQDGVRQAYGSSTKCGSTVLLSNRGVVEMKAARSIHICLSLCAFTVTCVEALVSWNNDDDVIKTCLLLSYDKDGAVNVPSADNCFLLTLGSYILKRDSSPSVLMRKAEWCGLPVCPQGYNVREPETSGLCSEEQIVVNHGHQDSINGITFPVDGRTTLADIKTHDIKVSTDSLVPGYTTVGMGVFQIVKSGIWGTQVLNNIAVSEVGGRLRYDTSPQIHTHMVKDKGEVETLKYNLDGTGASRSMTYGNTKVFARPSRGYVAMDSNSGTVDAVIQAIQDGFEPISAPPSVMYDEATGGIVMKGGHVTMAQTNTNGLILPIYYWNPAYNGNNNRKQIYREKFANSDTHGSSSGTTTWSFDPCWYPASLDDRQPEERSTYHLQRAIQEGRRVRVVSEGISNKVKAVYLTQTYTLFQLSPYTSPKHDYTTDANSQMVHTVVSTTGHVSACWHYMTQSAATQHESYVLAEDKVAWFVDSRSWDLVYTSTMAGLWRNGSLSELQQSVTDAADVNIVLELNDQGLCVSLLPEWLHVGQDSVVAEVKSLMDIDVTNESHPWPMDDQCYLLNYMIDSKNGVTTFRYSYGSNPTEKHIDRTSETGTVYWYISR